MGVFAWGASAIVAVAEERCVGRCHCLCCFLLQKLWLSLHFAAALPLLYRYVVSSRQCELLLHLWGAVAVAASYGMRFRKGLCCHCLLAVYFDADLGAVTSGDCLWLSHADFCGVRLRVMLKDVFPRFND